MSPDERTPGRDEHPCGADVAAYALGALEPAEAEAFGRHLETCAICPPELEAFRQVVDDLGAGVPRVEAPPDLKRRVMRAIEAEPRDAPAGSWRARRARRRDAVVRGRSWLRGPTLALGTAIAFAVAAIVVVVIAFPGRPAGRTVRASTTVGGTAALHISANNTELVVRHVAPPPRGKIYEVWVQHGTGRARANTLFRVDRDGDAAVHISGSIYGVSHVMVTAEPAPHGSRAPTGSPVITATLS
ncbi:MAG TPA: anti-sigma factor [Solirubrobacteraceae bacterium]|nr:anti-sigma factor [Solirubrobacteraceae bacterium]